MNMMTAFYEYHDHLPKAPPHVEADGIQAIGEQIPLLHDILNITSNTFSRERRSPCNSTVVARGSDQYWRAVTWIPSSLPYDYYEVRGGEAKASARKHFRDATST